MIEGLTHNEIRRLQELFIMSNDEQLIQIRIYLSMEIDRREKQRQWVNDIQKMRGGDV